MLTNLYTDTTSIDASGRVMGLTEYVVAMSIMAVKY